MQRLEIQAIRFIYTVSFIIIFNPFPRAHGFPENVRYGYNNCSSCHVSPTGGGALTAYGREASGEFLSTWSSPGEMSPFHGAFSKSGSKEPLLPESLSVGGDFRAMSFVRKNHDLDEKRLFPMQLDGEVCWQSPWEVTFAFAAGFYDKDAQIRRAYAVAQLTEDLYARVGRFFPAYGLAVPDHTALIRKSLGFNQGLETLNVEIGYIKEWGEIIVDPYVHESNGPIRSQDKGFSARSAVYIGKRSQIGLSALRLEGSVWKRESVGAFAAIGLSQSLYLLAELDLDQKKPTDVEDASLPASTKLITYGKVGWEFYRGLHIQGLYESSHNLKGTYDPRHISWGPGVQWFPRPHWELLGQLQQRYNDEYKKPYGAMASLLVHYYL